MSSSSSVCSRLVDASYDEENSKFYYLAANRDSRLTLYLLAAIFPARLYVFIDDGGDGKRFQL